MNSDLIAQIRDALARAEGFMSGFEDEPDMMNPDDLAAVRAALAAIQGSKSDD